MARHDVSCRHRSQLAQHMQPPPSAAAAPTNGLRDASAAAMALAGQELQAALDRTHIALSAASEHCRQFEGADGCRLQACCPVSKCRRSTCACKTGVGGFSSTQDGLAPRPCNFTCMCFHTLDFTSCACTHAVHSIPPYTRTVHIIMYALTECTSTCCCFEGWG